MEKIYANCKPEQTEFEQSKATDSENGWEKPRSTG
jgi:hypothetical protein